MYIKSWLCSFHSSLFLHQLMLHCSLFLHQFKQSISLLPSKLEQLLNKVF